MMPAVFRNARYEQRLSAHEQSIRSLFAMVSELALALGNMRAFIASETTFDGPDLQRYDKVH